MVVHISPKMYKPIRFEYYPQINVISNLNKKEFNNLVKILLIKFNSPF